MFMIARFSTFFRYLTLMGIMLWVLIALSFVFYDLEKAHAYHASEIPRSPLCIKFNGVSEKLVNGGSLNYDGSVAYSDGTYAGCVETEAHSSGSQKTKPVYDLFGSVWNTNLGWISMRCVGAKNTYENSNFNCGSVDYTSWVDQEGFLHGWWWGQGTGWVRLDWWCREGSTDPYDSNVPFADPGTCLNTNAPTGGKAPFIQPEDTESGLESGKVSGYVWSDSVGWIAIQGGQDVFVCDDPSHQDCWHKADLDVTLLLWTPKTYTNAIPPSPVSFSNTTPPTSSFPYDKTPYADTNQTQSPNSWILSLEVVDIGTGKHVYHNDGLYNIEVKDAPWEKDTLVKNQTCDSSDASCPSDRAYNTDKKYPEASSGSDYAYLHKIVSYAPTSNSNLDEATKKLYEPADIDTTNGDPRDGESKQHELCFKSIEVDITPVPGSGAPFIFDEPPYDFQDEFQEQYCDNNKVISIDTTFEHVKLGNGDLRFRPVVSVTKLTSNDKDYIVAQRNVDFPIELEGTHDDTNVLQPNIGVGFKVIPPEKPVFGYIVDEDGDGAWEIVDNNLPKDCQPDTDTEDENVEHDLWSSPAFDKIFTVLPYYNVECGTGTSEVGPVKARSFVSIDFDGSSGREVRYWSRPLPMEGNVNVSNPVVEVQGSVSSSGEVSARSDKPITSIGNVTYGVTRDEILRNVSVITRNVSPLPSLPSGDATAEVLANGSFDVDPSAKSIPVSGSTVWYVRGDLTFESGRTGCVNWKGDTTFIVQGGNVFIKDNLCSDYGKLGIIVLRSPDNDLWKAGNIFVQSAITDIYANMYADGAFMRYENEIDVPTTDNAYDVPTFTPNKRQSYLINQLYIKGSLSSANTIGGVDQSSKVDGYGNRDVTLEVATAYDLNFLSYFRVYTDPTTSASVKTGACSQTTKNKSTCDTPIDDPSAQHASVYFVYEAPKETLPGFSSKSSSSGTNLVR